MLLLSVQLRAKVHFSLGSVWCNFDSSPVNIQDSSEVNESSVEGKEKLGHRREVGYGPVAWRSFQRDFVCVRAFFSEQQLWIDNSLKKLRVWCVRKFWQTALGMPQGENNGVKQGSACGSNSGNQLLLKTLSVHVRILWADGDTGHYHLNRTARNSIYTHPSTPSFPVVLKSCPANRVKPGAITNCVCFMGREVRRQLEEKRRFWVVILQEKTSRYPPSFGKF